MVVRMMRDVTISRIRCSIPSVTLFEPRGPSRKSDLTDDQAEAEVLSGGMRPALAQRYPS